MASIVVSKEARKDLVSLHAYIRDELKTAMTSLSTFPGRGRPLDALIPIRSPYRYLVCENHCIFYMIAGDDVLIVRVLHQRQDCLRALFPGS